MKIAKRSLRNLGIFLIAIVFALALLFLVKNPDLFQASVLNVDEISTIQKNQRDIAYKQSSGLVDIFFSSSLDEHRPITLTLAHNPSVSIDPRLFSGQCLPTIVENTLDSLILSLDCPRYLPQESVLLIPFIGNSQDILLEDAFYSYGDEKHPLSIGNLSSLSQHGQ